MSEIKKHVTGLRLIRHILEEKSWDLLGDNDIKDSDFYGDSLQTLKELRKYTREYEEFPPVDVLESQVRLNCYGLNDFEISSKIPKKAAIDGFFEEKESRDLFQFQRKLQELRNTEGAKAAIEFAKSQSVKLGARVKDKVTSYKETGESRLKRHNEIRWSGTSTIKAPWPYFNEVMSGWDRPGANHLLAGISSTGKSWLSCVIALHAAFEQGLKVLLVSKENDLSSIENRLDSYYAKVPYTEKRMGELEYRSYDKYVRSIQSLEGMEGDVYLDEYSETVQDIHSLSEKYQADLVIVDGAYLVKPSTGYKDGTQKLTELANDYQVASKSQENTAWLSVIQLAPGAEQITSAKELGSKTRGSREWFINAASVLALTASPEDRMADRVRVSFAKGREMGEALEKDHWFIHSDRVNMNFEERPEHLIDPDLLPLI